MTGGVFSGGVFSMVKFFWCGIVSAWGCRFRSRFNLPTQIHNKNDGLLDLWWSVKTNKGIIFEYFLKKKGNFVVFKPSVEKCLRVVFGLPLAIEKCRFSGARDHFVVFVREGLLLQLLKKWGGRLLEDEISYLKSPEHHRFAHMEIEFRNFSVCTNCGLIGFKWKPPPSPSLYIFSLWFLWSFRWLLGAQMGPGRRGAISARENPLGAQNILEHFRKNPFSQCIRKKNLYAPGINYDITTIARVSFQKCVKQSGEGGN